MWPSNKALREFGRKPIRTIGQVGHSGALSDDGMQGRAGRQETSFLSIALFVTQCMTLGYLLKSSHLSFILDKMGPGLTSNTCTGVVEFLDSHTQIWETSPSDLLQSKVNPLYNEKWFFP